MKTSLSEDQIASAVTRGWMTFPKKKTTAKKAALYQRRFRARHPEYRQRERERSRRHYFNVQRGTEKRRMQFREAKRRSRMRKLMRRIWQFEIAMKRKLWGPIWREQAKKLCFERRVLYNLSRENRLTTPQC